MGTQWLRDRVAVVTGASRGIGLGTAEALVRAGARVVVASSERSAEALRTDAAAIGAVPVVCDVADPSAVDALFDEAERAGPVEVLVTCAAVLEKGPIDEIDLETWRRTLDVNLTGTWLCAKRAFASMKRAGGGRIVTLSSLSGVYPVEKFPGLGAYNVSKYGVIGLTEMLAVEGRDHNISAI